MALGVVVAGLALGPGLPPEAIVAGAMLLAALALRVPLVTRRSGGLALASLLMVAALAGTARTAALEHTRLESAFGHHVAGDVTLLTAVRIDAFGGRRALVRWRGEPTLLRLPVWDRDLAPEIGAILAVSGTLRAPDRAARGAHAHATLRATALRDTGRRRGGLAGTIDGVRRRAERALAGGLPPPEAALLRGMVLGQDEALPDDVRTALQNAGLAHLVAASGQNIMLLAALALALATVAGVGIRARWVLVLALITLYVPLAGAGPSIQRAGIMGAATAAAVLAGRPPSRWYAILLAAALTLGLDPRAVTDVGWQLSFAAVIGIVVLAVPARRRLAARGLPGPLAEAVAVTLAATLATAPLVAWHFDRSSLVALPANVLAAPAVAPVMWLGMIAAAIGQVAPTAAAPLVDVAGLALGYLIALGRSAAALPGAQVGVPPAAVLAVTALLAWGIVRGEADGARPRQRGRRLRATAVAAGTVLATLVLLGLSDRRPGPAPPLPGTLRVTALDVGQGDATLLQVSGHAVLVDAGPPDGGIVPALRGIGVRRLDAMVVTHAQLDHEGGAPGVLSAMPVTVLLDGRDGDRSPASRALDGPLSARGTRVVPAHAGQQVRIGALSLRILWPPPGHAAPGADPNDRAIVAVAAAGGARALLTADAESPVLAGLVLPSVDVLKVSHHGSADPGLPALLERLHPRVAMIEVGRHNSYGHPAPATVTALDAAVPAVLRTDRDGTVRVDMRIGQVTVTRER